MIAFGTVPDCKYYKRFVAHRISAQNNVRRRRYSRIKHEKDCFEHILFIATVKVYL